MKEISLQKLQNLMRRPVLKHVFCDQKVCLRQGIVESVKLAKFKLWGSKEPSSLKRR